jgi:hypothetical protein
MQLSDIFLALGEAGFTQLLRTVSIGKLKTYQLYERVKFRFHLQKLNAESLRKAAPKLYARIGNRDEEFATDMAQVILVSHLDMIKDALDHLGVPHDDGFFAKDLDPKAYFTEGWQQRAFDHLKSKYPEPLIIFYINHLDWELMKSETIFSPAPVAAN